jgi:oligopeptide/dipeptide ABC transporter ATP-binding protein
LPSGCSFAPRCPYALSQCAETLPAPVMCGDGHVARCVRAEERIKLAA